MFPAGQAEGSRGSGGEGRARLMARMRERRGGVEALPCGRRPATVPNMAYVASRCGMAPDAGGMPVRGERPNVRVIGLAGLLSRGKRGIFRWDR